VILATAAGLRRLPLAACLLIVLPAGAQIPPDPTSTANPELRFRIDEGLNINSFVRAGEVSAHLVLRSGRTPRILVAFPAGNSGVGLWFRPTGTAASWTSLSEPRPLTVADEHGRPLHGIETEAVIDSAALTIDRAVLSSVRVLRDYESTGVVPTEVAVAPAVSGRRLTWARNRLDGAPGFYLSLEVLEGASLTADQLTARPGDHLRLRIVALSGERPLHPLSAASVLGTRAEPDQRAREVLTFLSYREKLLAGSWRFNTYFGRDTLMSLALLAAVLRPEVIERGLSSVLVRLSPEGEVAHEEAIGEFAVLQNAARGVEPRDRPVYDYSMIDEDFMLAPVAERTLLSPALLRRAPMLLAVQENGVRRGDALVRNLIWLVQRTAAFAAEPATHNLIGLKPGHPAGQWRDSVNGLGGGIYPYDVNVVWVPAALRATQRLLDSRLLDPYLTSEQRRLLARAGEQFVTWSTRTAPLFSVTVDAEPARMAVTQYAMSLGVNPAPALSALVDQSSVQFDALALDAAARPISIMHSDGGLTLLFGEPTPAQLERIIGVTERPFPAGLMTPIGLLVANPALASPETQSRFTNAAYHGAVVWAWQQAVLAAGLERQLARTEVPGNLRTRLLGLRSRLWAAIDRTRSVRTSELWSWSFAQGRYSIEPFSQSQGHADESNAAQLWSTVLLGLRRPHSQRPVPTLMYPWLPTGTPTLMPTPTLPAHPLSDSVAASNAANAIPRITARMLSLLPVHRLSFCSTNRAPAGSVTTAMVPSRSCADGLSTTVPPSSSTRFAAATGSSTPK
jgi:hypothetical protein